MTNQTPENEPLLPESAAAKPTSLETEQEVDTQALANAILAGCVSGADISGHLETLGKLPVDQKETLQRHIGKLLAEHTSMLSEPHHWMTLQEVGREEYMTILRHALESANGVERLTISTKLADTLRREKNSTKKISSLDEAELLLLEAMDGVTSEKEKSPEALRALGSAYYTQSFIPFSRAEMTVGQEKKKERDHLILNSLVYLDLSRHFAKQGGDREGAIQSQIRAYAVHIDMDIGNMADLVPHLDAFIKNLQEASSTWANRFLNNALTRRVEASAKCSHPEWESFYRETMGRPGFEAQHGGPEKLKQWKEKNCPPALRKEEGLE